MPDIVIEIIVPPEPVERIKAKLLSEAFFRPLDDALVNIGLGVSALAKAKAPRDKGDLFRSISFRAYKGTHMLKVGTNLDYAPPVHGWMDAAVGRTTPHWVPPDVIPVLGEWAARKGIVYGQRYSTRTGNRLPGNKKTPGGPMGITDQNYRAGLAIAWAIHRKGTPMVPFLRDAFDESYPLIVEEVVKAGVQIAANWSAL